MKNIAEHQFEPTTSAVIKVLIVDDDLRTRRGLRALLATAHLDAPNADSIQIAVVGEATTGREACRLAHTTQPDVVLMDIHMPEMNGLQATRCIKAMSPDIKVIILTVRTQDCAAALAAGADAFLIKGGDTNALLETVYSSGER